jgi:methyltransferase (TIGR00027 family)
MAASERASGGHNAFIPVRVRWFDDLIASAAPQVRQVVLLGAGLDTRAFRLGLPADLDWYEVDHHEVLVAKDSVLAGCVPGCRRHVVAGDVGGDWGWQLQHVTAPGGPDANYGRLPPQKGGLIPGRTHLISAQRHPVR